MYIVRVFLIDSLSPNFPYVSETYGSIDDAFTQANFWRKTFHNSAGRVAILCDGKLLRTYELS